MTDPDYTLSESQFAALAAGESDALANASNFVALLYNAIEDVNWLGIYVLRMCMNFPATSRATPIHARNSLCR